MPHHAARRVPLLLQSSFTKSFTYRTSTRNFHASTANMTIKTFFDVTWEGPVLDASGKPTSKVADAFLVDADVHFHD
jgi:peptidylprolyl isomerase